MAERLFYKVIHRGNNAAHEHQCKNGARNKKRHNAGLLKITLVALFALDAYKPRNHAAHELQ